MSSVAQMEDPGLAWRLTYIHRVSYYLRRHPTVAYKVISRVDRIPFPWNFCRVTYTSVDVMITY